VLAICVVMGITKVRNTKFSCIGTSSTMYLISAAVGLFDLFLLGPRKEKKRKDSGPLVVMTQPA